MHAATCPKLDEPVTMTRRALEATMWISAKVGHPGHDNGEGEIGWFMGGDLDDQEGEPPEYIELRYGGDAPEVDVIVMSDLAYTIIGYCIAHGIKVRDVDQMAQDDERAAKAALGLSDSAVRH